MTSQLAKRLERLQEVRAAMKDSQPEGPTPEAPSGKAKVKA